jgi:hypothetical protein
VHILPRNPRREVGTATFMPYRQHHTERVEGGRLSNGCLEVPQHTFSFMHLNSHETLDSRRALRHENAGSRTYFGRSAKYRLVHFLVMSYIKAVEVGSYTLFPAANIASRSQGRGKLGPTLIQTRVNAAHFENPHYSYRRLRLRTGRCPWTVASSAA